MMLVAVPLALAGCGAAGTGGGLAVPPDPTPAVDEPAPSALVGVEWGLLEVVGDGERWSVPPEVDSVLRFDGDGGWSAEACNQMAGEVDLGPGRLDAQTEWVTAMACQGADDRVEDAVGAVLDGRVTWSLDDGLLRLDRVGGPTLLYRERASIYPDPEARTVVAGELGEAQYRVAVSGSGERVGMRLVSRPAPGTPWGVMGIGGPLPGGPVLPYGVSGEVAGKTLVAGFAPVGTERVAYRGTADARPVELTLETVEGVRTPAWHGFVAQRTPDHEVIAYDADGDVLESWPTPP